MENLRPVRTPSGGGGSPGLFTDDAGNYVVRGYIVDPATAPAIHVPAGEALVRVPVELLLGLTATTVA